MIVLSELKAPVSHSEWLQVIQDVDYQRQHSHFEIPYVLRYNYKNWRIRFDINSIFQNFDDTPRQFLQIRFQASFINKDDFQFTLLKKNWSSKILKFFGMQDIKINDFEFDSKFIIKSNNERMMINLLKDQKIKDFILNLDSFPLHTTKDENFVNTQFLQDENILCWEKTALKIDDFPFQEIFQMFEAILDRMAILGITKEEPPTLRI